MCTARLLSRPHATQLVPTLPAYHGALMAQALYRPMWTVGHNTLQVHGSCLSLFFIEEQTMAVDDSSLLPCLLCLESA